MSTIIKIKNSGVSGSPSALATGELAYSYLTGTLSNGGDRLYIGTGSEDPVTGAAANLEVIGGTYFTSKLDHTPGTLTASSALIVDANSKIDIFNVDNLRLDGNTISSTDANGDINVTPNGTGDVNITTLGDVVISGANLTINGLLDHTGDVEVDGDIHATGTLNIDGQSTLASLNVEDLTAQRLVYVGASGELVDSSNLTFDGTSLIVGTNKFTVAHATGNTQVVGTLNVDGQSTLSSVNVEDLTATRVVYVGTDGELVDSSDMVFTGSGATSQLQLIGKLNVDAQSTLASLNVEDLTATRVTFAGTNGELVDNANFTFITGTNTLQLTGDQDITGSLDVDNINIDGNVISSTNSNGNVEIAPNALGLTVINSATALQIAKGNTASRPGTPVAGMIRFNTTDGRYEAYDGIAWGGLGGVIDVDQNTFIRAETTPGANNNDLEFYTDGVKRVNLDENGMVFTDTSIPLQVGKIKILDDTISSTSGGVIYIDPNPSGSEGSVVIEGNLTVNGVQTIVNSTTVSIDDPVFNLGGDTVPTVNDGLDKGIAFQWYDTAAHVGFFGWDLSDERFKFIPEATETGGTYSGTLGDVAFGNALVNGLTFSAGNYTTTSVLATDGSGNVSFVNEDSASVFGVEGQVLQMNSSGVPSFGHIDCGTY
jgi:hypothetical protein